jgi:hypothetical protein
MIIYISLRVRVFYGKHFPSTIFSLHKDAPRTLRLRPFLDLFCKCFERRPEKKRKKGAEILLEITYTVCCKKILRNIIEKTTPASCLL